MRNAVQAGARIPTNIFDLHTRNVQEKYDGEKGYTGIAAELAIREYLDKDDFAELEERLRDRCASLGSSPAKQKKSLSSFETDETKLAQWRIREELKEELKKYAKESDHTYSDVFARAIREYWTNSRSERIEALYDRLETAIEPFEDQIDSDGVNATVVDKRTAEIAMELGDGDLLRPDIEDAIAEVTSDSEYNRDKYTPLVAEYKGLEEHPMNQADSEKPDIFVSHEEAEELRKDPDVDVSEPSLFEQSFDELSSEECDLRVCARLYQKAKSRNGKSAMDHSEILDEFDDEPGQTTVYNIMERVSERPGFDVSSRHGTKRVRFNAKEVEQEVVEAAERETSVAGA